MLYSRRLGSGFLLRGDVDDDIEARREQGLKAVAHEQEQDRTFGCRVGLGAGEARQEAGAQEEELSR